MKNKNKEFGPFGMPQPPSDDLPAGFSDDEKEILGTMREREDIVARLGSIRLLRRKKGKLTERQYLDMFEPHRDMAKQPAIMSGDAPTTLKGEDDYYGIVASDRDNEDSQYRDFFVSSFPGDAHVHTRAVGEGRGKLRSEDDVRAYILSVGPYREPYATMTINVGYQSRELVGKIHASVFRRLIHFRDLIGARQERSAVDVLKAVKQEFAGENDIYSPYSLIEIDETDS